MGVVNQKDVPEKQNSLGQFFTPSQTADFCLANTSIDTPLVIEPSCGEGVFLNKIHAKTILGLEVDEHVLKQYIGPVPVMNTNFYDFDLTIDSDITFIGNPPYRTPAISVTDDKKYGRKDIVKGLKKKYNISGIREEAVFFILKSVDLILRNKVNGHIYYILPKTIFHNNSKAYKTFFDFLCKYTKLESVIDLSDSFEKVTTDLCWVHWSVGYGTGGETGFYGVQEDMISFHNIFKKTYLGSVPCESVLLSVRGEPLEHFKQRLFNLFSQPVNNKNELLERLSYGGEVHLAALKRGNEKKLDVVWWNVCNISRLVYAGEFLNDEHYKPIRHRNEDRWYFRHAALKKAKDFVYQLNPNPCPSFYFPGNPAKGCLDYHGFCEYDVNRNCSPSANRTVPIQGVEANLTDEFKEYWKKNTGLPYDCVFEYLSYILKSDWYKEMKTKYQRFYFGVPKIFDKRFNGLKV